MRLYRGIDSFRRRGIRKGGEICRHDGCLLIALSTYDHRTVRTGGKDGAHAEDSPSVPVTRTDGLATMRLSAVSWDLKWTLARWTLEDIVGV